MDYYGIDADELKIKQALAQAAALRNQRAPQGQNVGSGGFTHYVAPHWTQQLGPLAGQVAADFVDQRAVKDKGELDVRSQRMLADWVRGKPQAKTEYGAGEEGPTMKQVEPTDADTQAWAAQGLRNPLSRAIAQKTLEDNIVNAPVRQEKAEAKKDQILLTNQRYDEDRKQRAALAAQQAEERMSRLLIQIEANQGNQQAQLALRQQYQNESLRLRELQINAGIAKGDADRDSRERIAADKAERGTRGGKGPLSATQMKEIAGFEDAIERNKGLAAGFKPEYIGPRAALMIESGYAGSFASKDPAIQEMANWWRDFKANDNVERHALFGSALTASEKAAWQKTTVSPLSNPQQIMDAIATRQRIAEAAMNRRLELYTKGPKGLEKEAAPPAPAGPLNKATGRPVVTKAEQSGRDADAASILVNEALKMPMSPDEYESVVKDARRKGYKGEMPPRVPLPGETPAAAPTKTKVSDEELLNKYLKK